MNKTKALEKLLAIAGNAACEYPKPYDNKVFHYSGTVIDYISYKQGGTEVFRHTLTYTGTDPITWKITVY